MNGYNKSKDLFSQNSRVKSLEVTLSDGSSQTFAIKDIMGIQEFKLGKTVKWVKFIVKEVIEGSKYKDLCISELKIVTQ